MLGVGELRIRKGGQEESFAIAAVAVEHRTPARRPLSQRRRAGTGRSSR